MFWMIADSCEYKGEGVGLVCMQFNFISGLEVIEMSRPRLKIKHISKILKISKDFSRFLKIFQENSLDL